jgi:SpoIID/LytB domain protein
MTQQRSFHRLLPICLAAFAAAPSLSAVASSSAEPTIRVLNIQTSQVLTLPLEEYLRGVVPSEIGATTPPSAQQAQAVAARSFAAVALHSKKHADQDADVCSTVHCQVHNPSKATKATDDAVSATRGLILTYKGKPFSAYYSAMCGGHTEDIVNVWSERMKETVYHGATCTDGPGETQLDLANESQFAKWLASDPDVYCNPSKSKVPDWTGRNFRWTREFTAGEIESFDAKRKPIGTVTSLRTGTRGVSGRLTKMDVVGTSGTIHLNTQMEIREFFKPALRSSAFLVETGGEGNLRKFTLRGTGSGHGVGMCQTGAMGMAAAGKSFREILKHYYPRAKIESLY